ncbi:MAG TPA: sterol desaturase family protein [Thermoanaerobaculia bacterium]|nr:sterol desaturase family protein [Thermoanaerobaculia bacterium]
MRKDPIPGWVTAVVFGGAFLGIALLERRRPLRGRREPPLRRLGRNLTLGGISAAATTALQGRLLEPLARRIERRRLGLLPRLPLPPALRTILGVLLLDYTLWWWHRLNHQNPLFWRFHVIHHIDLDLDASTAVRFHFGEMMLSVFFRSAQFRLIGPDALASTLWQLMLLVSIVFHHSNLRLPERAERVLSRLLVTPRLHGIHHSTVRDQTSSNWSSLLSLWDLLHGTFRDDVPQDRIRIGVPAWQDPREVTLGEMLVEPLRPHPRDAWLPLPPTSSSGPPEGSQG